MKYVKKHVVCKKGAGYSSKSMQAIFTYMDFRQYLRDFYLSKKKLNKSYSYRFFAKKAGLSSPNYYKLVMDGSRNITHKTMRKFIKGLEFSDKEGLFFENLVFFNQAQKKEEKDFFARNLENIKRDSARGLLTKDQYEVLSTWYPLAIKELLLLAQVDQSNKGLAAALDFSITPVQAKEAVELLLRLGLLEKLQNGKLKVTKKSLQTPNLVHSNAVVKYFQQMWELAQGALEHQSASERCFSGLTVAVNKKDLAEAFSRIYAFRNEMDSLFGKRKKLDAVYQLNLQLFRLDQDV